MAEVNWIKGTINPPSSGEYYYILEAQCDIPYFFKKGDVEITTDYYSVERGEWDEIGKDNPSWKVLAWADILHPNIPRDLMDKCPAYFGLRKVDGKWQG